VTRPAPGDWRRAAARRAVVPVVLMFAGLVVVVVAGGNDDGRVAGWVVFSLGLILAIALLFLEIGYSEDRDRERRGP
jgi:hypothetical protein